MEKSHTSQRRSTCKWEYLEIHKEIIRLYVIHSPNNPVIRGLPWLCRHNPHISWKEGQIVQWDTICHDQCLLESSLPFARTHNHCQGVGRRHLRSTCRIYLDLAVAFSRIKASNLPPHRSSDCSIDLLPGATPPKSRISLCSLSLNLIP